MFSCLIILVNICIHQADNIQIQQTTLGFSATLRSGAITAQISALSDNFSTPDWSKMNEACEGGVCVAYFKHCARDNEAQFCEYHFSQPGDMQNTIVRIVAKEHDKIRQAESGFGVAIRTGWKAAVVPFSRFSVESSADTPPYCQRRTPQSACWSTRSVGDNAADP